MDIAGFFAAVTAGDDLAVENALGEQPELARATVVDDSGGGEQVTALHLAVRRGEADIVALLLDAGADVNAVTSAEGECRTALHDSYEYGQEAITRFLLACGAAYDINVAAARGDFDRVRLLLDDDPELVNDTSTGLSPLGWAGYGQDPLMVPFLLDHGADLNDEICCPCGTGNLAILQAFLDAGADPDGLSDGWQGRPLHVAVAMRYTTRNTGAVEALLDAGADIEGTAGDGTTTPLALAHRKQAEAEGADQDRSDGYAAIIALLEAGGARIGWSRGRDSGPPRP